MRVHNTLFTALSVVALVVVACSSHADAALSVDEYAKRDCAISAEVTGNLKALQRQLAQNIVYPSLMADNAAAIADLFNGAAGKSEKLGDPPNGEGVGAAKVGAEMMRSLAADLEQSAAKLRTAATDDEFAAAVNDLWEAFGKAGPASAEFKAKYPTPGVDALEKKIPGCADETN
jgi:hypothetical protein